MLGDGSERWSALFADLEARLDAAASDELAGEVADRTRRERARVPLADRLRAAVPAAPEVSARVEGAGLLRGRLADSGPDWLLLHEASGREALVPLRALLHVSGVGAAAQPGTQVGRRLDLRWALRGLVRDRSPVTLVLRDGTGLAGTLDASGDDVLDLAVHPPGELRRRGAVRDVALVPLRAVALVRRGPG